MVVDRCRGDVAPPAPGVAGIHLPPHGNAHCGRVEMAGAETTPLQVPGIGYQVVFLFSRFMASSIFASEVFRQFIESSLLCAPSEFST